MSTTTITKQIPDDLPRVRLDATPVTLIAGPTRHSALIFGQYADEIEQETGIDVYERNVVYELAATTIEGLIDRWRESNTFSDAELRDIRQGLLRDKGVLSDEEQQEKDKFTLATARVTKNNLRGTSDAARFGYCKRQGCLSRKVRRLLLRGFCPDCRGVSVTQTIAGGGSVTDMNPFAIAASPAQMSTSLVVKHDQPHKDTEKSTVGERHELVLAARQTYPAASQRELAALTSVSQKHVSRILKNK